MIRIGLAVLHFAIGLTAAACDNTRWAECVGWPDGNVVYDERDPAVGTDADAFALSPLERVEHWKQQADGDGDVAIRALIELGWHETQQRKPRVARRHYDRALALPTDDSALRRRLHWSLAQSCAETGDFRCAREHWLKAGRLASGHPRWLPAAYAYGLWDLGEQAQAIAWYTAAVHGNAVLGRGDYAGILATGTPLNHVSQALFKAWSSEHAPMLAMVLVKIDIGPDGRVQRVVLLDHSLSPELASRVQVAIAGWRFEPPLHQGKPATLTTHAQVDIRGRVDDETGTAHFEIQHVSSGVYFDSRKRTGLRYPKEASRSRREGFVRIRVQVRPDGTVGKADVEQSSGHQALDQAALRAVSGWTFLTDSIDGEGQPGEAIVPIDFRMSNVTISNVSPIRGRARVVRGLSRGF